jgi:methyl-accepting chemotaxis protein
MKQISTTVTNSSNMVKHLKERSNQIGLIVEAISKIAEQTNLLAINTAIEAARMGEGAREFRVIADEIRKLAEATGKAGDQIVRLLREIQTETNQVITSTEVGAQEVEDGVAYVNKTGAALEELTKAVLDISNLANEISKNTMEQSAGFEQVRKAIVTVSSISEENASSTEGVLKLTQRESELTKKITESSSQLKKLSEELNEIVTKFKVNE